MPLCIHHQTKNPIDIGLCAVKEKRLFINLWNFKVLHNDVSLWDIRIRYLSSHFAVLHVSCIVARPLQGVPTSVTSLLRVFTLFPPPHVFVQSKIVHESHWQYTLVSLKNSKNELVIFSNYVTDFIHRIIIYLDISPYCN